MAGELSFLTIQEVEVVAAEGVVVALVVLIWSAMSVVSLVILPVNAVCVVVQGDVVAAVRDIAGAQVMDEGVTALVGDPQDAAVCHLVGVAIADHHRTVGVRSCHMPTEMVQGIVAEAGVEQWKLGNLPSLGGSWD